MFVATGLARARAAASLEGWLAAERGRFTLWLPVFMGIGVLGYFSLRAEPPWWLGATAAAPAVIAALLLRPWPVPRAAAFALAAAALGFASSQFATERAPPLENLPTHATVLTGTVRGVEIFPEGRRITLEAGQLDGAPPLTRWLRVRLRPADQQDINAGDTIRVRTLLRPPAPPAYPGAWDLQRDAWFSGHGGSGYALGPVERIAAAPTGASPRLVQRLREAIGRHISAAVPGAAGAVSITLLTGVTTGIPPLDHDAFRSSGLAHLLAVAGLHIGIVMGWVLAFSRLAFAASEYASLHWPTKKLSALAALFAGGCYMVLTGMHLPITRAFAMACLYTIAVIAGRRAVSLRGLALAATVLMLIEPQEVPGVSFQMSFSAVLALIAGYEVLRPALRSLHGSGSWQRRFASHLAALALTSALAGTASAPFAAYHFGRIQVYFVVANMVAVPLTALWVMPAGLIGLALMPVGLDWLAWVPMGWGAQVVLWVARTTAALPVSTFEVPQMPAWGLAATALGVAWLGLWRSRLRLIGVPVIALGVMSPMLQRPPDILVSADARLIAVRVAGTVFLQHETGASKFTRDAWLQYWAAGPPITMPADATAAGGAVICQKDACLLRPVAGAKAVLLVRGALHPDGCGDASIIVSAEPARGLCPKPWPALVDRFTVWRYGAVAIWLDGTHARIVTDRAWRGARPWVPPPPLPHKAAVPVLPAAKTETQAVGE